MVITQPCFGCKYTDCVTVCPTDCFHEGDSMLYIDPESCVECGACIAECPTSAIFQEDDVPPEWHDFIDLNREMSAQTPLITERRKRAS